MDDHDQHDTHLDIRDDTSRLENSSAIGAEYVSSRKREMSKEVIILTFIQLLNGVWSHNIHASRPPVHVYFTTLLSQCFLKY